MASPDLQFDYLKVLGLDIDVGVQLDPAALQERIRHKKKELTAQAVNPLYKDAARASLERLRDFERIIGDPKLREEFFRYRRHLDEVFLDRQRDSIRQWVAIASAGRRSVTTSQLEWIARHASAERPSASFVAEILRQMNVEVRSGDAPAPPVIPYREPALDRTILRQIHEWLGILGKGSLYELIDQPERASPVRLISSAQNLFAKWSKVLPKTSLTVAWEKSLQACLTYLKDDDVKAKYDRALYNHRLDQFLQRIDLVLEGGRLGTTEMLHLTRIGLTEFGLTGDAIEESVKARSLARGVTAEEIGPLTVRIDAMVQCRRCRALNPRDLHTCDQCGSSLERVCENPSCRHELSVAAKSCPSCGLSVARGRQFAELLRLVDVLLTRGLANAALEAARLAGQILSDDAVRLRIERATAIRVAVVSLRKAAARHAWTRVFNDLSSLLAMAPDFQDDDIPSLEQLAQAEEERLDRLHAIDVMTDPVERARQMIDLLSEWTDSPRVIDAIRQMAHRFAESRNERAAVQLAQRLLPFLPANDVLHREAAAWRELAVQNQEHRQQQRQLADTFQTALHQRRLYHAERLLAEFQGEVPSALRASMKSLQDELAQVQEELAAVRRREQEGASADELMERHYRILANCRDCRESLAALQSLEPDPPLPPRSPVVEVVGPARVIRWGPPEGKRPTRYLVERLAIDDNDRHAPSAQAETGDTYWRDETPLPAGIMAKYVVTSVLEGRTEVGGSTLRTWTRRSPPVAAVTSAGSTPMP